MKTYKFLLCIAILITVVCGQASSQILFENKPVDPDYVNVLGSRWGIRLYAASKENRLYMYHKNWDERVSFIPQSKVNVGLGLSYKNLSIDLGVALFNQSELPGQKTTAFNFIGGLFNKQNVLDIVFQINKGFVAEGVGDTTNKYLRDDLRIFNFGINYNYVFNYTRYSFNAPFIGTQIQKRSAGSPMAGAFFTALNLSGNDTLLPSEFASGFNHEDLFSYANFFSGGLTAGYAYTFVLPAHFFLTACLTPGIVISFGETVTDTTHAIGNPVTLSAKLITRGSIGYAGKKFYGILNYNLDINGVALGNKTRIIYTPEKAKIIFGYRIK